MYLVPTWSDWTPGTCSVTCGVGTEQRSRTCSNGPCEGSATETIACSEPACRKLIYLAL